MNKFLKSVHKSVSNNKDEIIRKSLIDHLSNSVKEIQYFGLKQNRVNNDVDIKEAESTLCNTLEALFLHGLKDSLTNRFKMAIADIDERPEPSFWPPLLIISHRQIIDQITSLSQIISEVGQCRAWIRLALNDCLLSSYVMTMRQDNSALKGFYKNGAFVRDAELLEMAQKLLEGVESFYSFNLPCNSSLLNNWHFTTLNLAGIWGPTLKNCPVAPCDDVAQGIEDITQPLMIPEKCVETSSAEAALSYNSQSSGLRQIVSLSEDEVLKIILGKDKANMTDTDVEVEAAELTSNVVVNVGNSLKERTGWSFDGNKEETEENQSNVAAVSEAKPSTIEAKFAEASFNALIESYNMISGGFIRTPDIREVWQKYEINKQQDDLSPNNDISHSSPIHPSINKSESTALSVQVCKICKEKGLDNQNFECLGCQKPLDFNNKLRVCAFTGGYFCDDCMCPELITIPARIVHNWDFKLYEVSQKAYNYINEIKDHPTIDFKVVNPYIYSVVEEMELLQTLRNQLNFLRAYLYTCREPIISDLQKKMWPREYMYEHIHQYSISDLSEIKNGVLASLLEKVVDFGKEHVSTCWLCSQKGFLCEICNKSKPLFPFDTDNIYRCATCFAVYHKSCLNATKPCPKCTRIKRREDLPLLGAITLD